MKLSRKEKEEILFFIRGGYTQDSIKDIMKKKTNGKDISAGDILLIAKQAGIKSFGKKEFNEKEAVKENIVNVLQDKESMSRVKKTLIVLAICLCVMIGVVGYMWGLQPMLITLGIVIGVFLVFVFYFYFTYVKGNKSLQKLKNQRKKS